MIREFEGRGIQSLTYDRQEDGTFLVTVKCLVPSTCDMIPGPQILCIQYRVGADMDIRTRWDGEVRKANGENFLEMTTLEVRTQGRLRPIEDKIYERVWWEQ